MKKTAIIICSIVLAFVIAAGAFLTQASPSEKKASIGAEEALSIALKDAGVKAEKAVKKEAVFSKENGKDVFDVEFEVGENEYDYLIDAENGSIIERKVEKDDDKSTAVPTTAKESSTAPKATEKATDAPLTTTTVPSASSVTVPETTVPRPTESSTTATRQTEPSTTSKAAEVKPSSTYISAKRAKEIALSDAGCDASKAKFTKIKLDSDDGIREYEIEFYVGNVEYEYSINAKTGAVLEKDIEKKVSRKEPATEKVTTTKSNSENKKFIGIHKAKSIAFSHAGVSENEIRLEKVELDRDDGVYEYEIEFSLGRTEYEYTINAKTGKIIDFDKEIDD